MRVLRYVARRLLLAALVMVCITIVTFFVSRVLPSHPAALYAGAHATAEQIHSIEERMGLNEPVPVQFWRYLVDLVHGELGVSFRTRQPISRDIVHLLPATLELITASTFLALLIGVPLGVITGYRPGSLIDHVARMLSAGGVAVPSFWLALLLQIFLARRLGILPLAGRVDNLVALQHPIQTLTGFHVVDAAVTGNWVGFRSAVSHLILPAFVLATYSISVGARMTRSTMIEVLSEGYIKTARAMGISERTILFRLALQNAIMPTLTVIGLAFAWSITGAFLVESVFNWPGIGKYVADAILMVDFPVVVAVTLVVTVFYVLVNLVLDLINAVIDPRVQLG